MEILALAAAAGGAALAAWIADRRRARLRNVRGRCAACGDPWKGTAADEPFLIHGRLVCAACAHLARRRIVWHFGALISAVAFASAMIVAKEGIVALVSVPLGTTLLMTLGAIEAMKIANRRAQLRIARGELDDYHAVGSPHASPLVAPGATPDGAPLSSP